MPAGPPPTTATVRLVSAGVMAYSSSRQTCTFTLHQMVRAIWSPRARQPSLQRMQGRMSSGRPSLAFFGHSGSAQRGRPSPMKSPLPVSRISSASFGLVMEPEAITGMLTCFFAASAAQVLWARLMPMGLTSWMVWWWLPPLMWMAATPRASRRLESSMVSSMVWPSGS